MDQRLKHPTVCLRPKFMFDSYPRLSPEVRSRRQHVGGPAQSEVAVEVGLDVDHGDLEGTEGSAGGEESLGTSHGHQPWSNNNNDNGSYGEMGTS